jgi:CubicO group peptidase (beta-lactamase class C family)
VSAGAAALDRLLAEALAEDRFAGAVLRVERRGRVLYEQASGWALRTDAERKPMTPDTVFDLASLSKLFTATAALALVTRGVWSLATPAAEFLGLDARGSDGTFRAALEGVDLRALLAHSSGLHHWHPCYVRAGAPFSAILSDVLAAHPRKPGTTVYSDLNFMILGLGVERAAGLPLPEAMARLVFNPLGMEGAHYRLRGAVPPVPASAVAATEFGNRIERRMVADLGLAFSLWRGEEAPIRGEADDGNCWYYFGGAAGHAGVFCGAADLCRLGRLYAEGGAASSGAASSGAADGGRLIDPGLAALAVRDSGAGRGLGFQLGENYPGGGAGHTGFTGTYLYVHAPTGLVAAALTNRLHVREPGDLNPFRRRFAETALGAFGEERSL